MATLTTLILFLLLSLVHNASSQPFIGVNYGQVADNLPLPSESVSLLQSTTIQKVRLYGADPAIINALANTGISIVIGVANEEIPSLSTIPKQAASWISSHVIPYYPASNIILITIGNEVLTSGNQNLISQLLPAMRNMQNALNSMALGGKIKVSTVHSMAVLSRSAPPSSGQFNPAFQDVMRGLLQFLKETSSPLLINPYAFFAYQSDPRPETLAFCLFKSTSGRYDPATGITYMNMFDAQVDAVHSALSAIGFRDIEIVVAETGWPYKGDINEVGTSVDNSRAYNGNLIAHLRSMVGTPLMPGKSVDTYIFALYDENLKPGRGSEQAFGLFKPDRSMIYDVGLLKSPQSAYTPPRTPPTPTQTQIASWCVPKPEVSEMSLQANIDYACSQGIDCSPTQPSGVCFEPNTVFSHAAYAMNLYYQTAGKNPLNCDFSQTGIITVTDPSYNSCIYPGRGAGGRKSLK